MVDLLVSWIQTTLQRELNSIEPTLTWNASDPQDLIWLRYRYQPPRIARTVWIDGSSYAAMVGCVELADISALLDQCGYRLIERSAAVGERREARLRGHRT